jgi:hypothetical protein
MDALDLLQMHANLRHELLIRAYLAAWGDETSVRNYGDLTVDHNVRRIDVDKDEEDDE